MVYYIHYIPYRYEEQNDFRAYENYYFKTVRRFTKVSVFPSFPCWLFGPMGLCRCTKLREEVNLRHKSGRYHSSLGTYVVTGKYLASSSERNLCWIRKLTAHSDSPVNTAAKFWVNFREVVLGVCGSSVKEGIYHFTHRWKFCGKRHGTRKKPSDLFWGNILVFFVSNTFRMHILTARLLLVIQWLIVQKYLLTKPIDQYSRF